MSEVENAPRFSLSVGTLPDLPGRLVVFGLLTAFASSIGQTFFISLSNLHFRETYDLNGSQLSLAYGGATLASAGFMLWLGRLIDRVDLPGFTGLAVAILAGGAVTVTLGGDLLYLVLGLFLLRLGGQGLMGHVAAVSVTRTGGSNRGKATALALLGHALGEASVPLLWAATVGFTAWQSGWLAAAALLGLVYLPAAVAILPRAARRVPGPALTGQHLRGGGSMFADRRFAVLVLCAILPPSLLTAFLFHLQSLTPLPGGTADLALAFPAMAAGSVMGGLIGGVCVDRFGGKPVRVASQLPLAVGSAAFALEPSLTSVAIALAAMGMAGGTVNASATPAWAELFGVQSVGRARSMQAFSVVAGTALVPVAFGLALDVVGGATEAIALASTLAACCVALLARPAAR